MQAMEMVEKTRRKVMTTFGMNTDVFNDNKETQRKAPLTPLILFNSYAKQKVHLIEHCSD